MKKETIEKLVSLGLEYGQCTFEYLYKLLPDFINFGTEKHNFIIDKEYGLLGYSNIYWWLIQEIIIDDNINETIAQLYINLKSKNLV